MTVLQPVDSAPAYAKPLPAIEPLTAPFWEGCRVGELRLQRCASCGAFRHPPRPMCGACRSTDVVWVASAGRGRIWSWTIVHPPVLPAFQTDVPYNVIVVELDEGVRLVSNLVDAGGDDIQAGAPVEVTFFPATDTVTLPRFRLVSGAVSSQLGGAV
jgi:uncharacterized OB-fold protein